ncbi:MAG: T9SS type A sorting domain-containing protein [Lewinellaceae bacterium]|nr:T9SS type A sorting domain-containing protein [Lewinellaceae bacterium]
MAAAEDLTVECPTDPMLPACSSTADILAAYNAWVAGFSFDGGCDVSDNIDNVPALGDLTCGGQLSFTYTATSGPDGCQDMASCNAAFTVAAAEDLTVECPQDPMLPACSTDADILAAYNAWAAGFSFDGGCDVTDNINDVPALGDLTCGGQLSFTYTATSGPDGCQDMASCNATFTVQAPAPLTANCPANQQINECLTQAEVDAAFAIWIGQFAATGGCNPQGSDLSQYVAPDYCGGSVTVTFTATDDCGETDECSATFTVSSGLAVSCPLDANLGGCTSQDEVDIAFANWLSQFETTGGCDPQSTDLSQYTAPSFCGGSVLVIYKAKDVCGRDVSCSATFTVGGPDVLEVSCPADRQLGSCLTQAEVDAAFATWLGLFSTTGGCFAQNSDLQSYSAPSYCGGSVTVKYYAWDRCGQSAQCSAVFSVAEPAPLAVSCPQDRQVDGCSAQSQIDAAFANWIGQFSVTGGCSPQRSNLQNYSAPSSCGGSTTVDFYAWDKCGNWDICSATFTVTPDDGPLTVSCPQNYKLDACYSQDQINAAFASWISQFSTSGGCSPQSSNLQNYTAPSKCGGSVTVKFIAWDQCGESATCTATFTVKAPAPLSVVCPANENVPGCQTQNQVNAAFMNWISQFSTMGGCGTQRSSLQNYAAPSACGGSVTVKFYAWDKCGQSDYCSATFTVGGSQPLSVSCPSDLTLSGCQPQSDVNAAFASWKAQFGANGSCGGTPFYFVNGVPVTTLANISAPPACGGSVSINLMLVNQCNQMASCTATFTVPNDGIGPKIWPAKSVKVQCDGNGNTASLNYWLSIRGGAKASDNCGAVSWSHNFSGLSDECGATGSATVTFTATDQCGNTSNTTATFMIVDTEPPTGDCPEGLTGLTSPSQAPGPNTAAVRAAYSDACSDVQVKYTGTVTETTGSGCQGFEVRHSYVIGDACGNLTYCTVTHSGGGGGGSISGNCPSGEQGLDCEDGLPDFEAAYLASFFTGADGGPVDVEPVDTTLEFVDCKFELIYYYVVTDNCGNEKNCSITYRGEDTTPPQGACPEGFDVQTYGQVPRPDTSYIREFFSDECSDFRVRILLRKILDDSGPCQDVTVLNIYELTDLCGNTTRCSVPYYIEEVNPDLITCPPDITNMQCWADVPTPQEAQEIFEYYNSPGTQVVFIGQTVDNNFCQFTYKYAYSVEDPCVGDRTVCVLTFTGQDLTPPAPTADGGCPEGLTGLSCQDEVPDPDPDAIAARYTDNCSTPFAYLTKPPVIEGDFCGDFTVTHFYRVYDDCDNFVECTVVYEGGGTIAEAPGGGTIPIEPEGISAEQKELALRAYPNPTHNELFLEFEYYKGEQATLTVYNVYGKPVLARTLVLDQPTYRLGLLEAGLASGSYFINVQTEDTVIVKTVILARN